MSLTVLGGITFVLVFAGSILLHEFGHFIVARLVGIEVEEFGVGIPPRMLTLFTWKGTKFTLNWLPLGGFNRMKGEDNPETKGGFMDAKPWARITTLLAGSAMNILTAILAFSIYFTQIGIPNYSKVQILDVSPGSPAMQAGIQVNDVVISAGGQEITDTYQLSNIIRENLDQPLALVIMRGDTTINLDVIPDSNRSIQEGATGMLLGSMLEPAKSWFATIPISFQATFQTGRELLSLPGRLIAGVIQPSDAELLGPRSIWNLFQESVQRDVESRQPGSETQGQAPTNYTLSGIISLTLSLGIINLLPIPALDGGRIFFILLEVIFRKRVPARFESMIHGITFVILISVLGYFYIMDFIHPVSIILP
ncbi:MAG TPA: M50 family metallopeptidase [Anaerolineales bacterium]|nr:M50 family metallopeptidase [Anaerolineales bacterium]